MKFEYFVTRINMQTGAVAQTELNKLGAEGWELVSLETEAFAGRAVFKRPLKE